MENYSEKVKINPEEKKGIGVFFVLIASWDILSVLLILSMISRLSQLRVFEVLSRDFTLPDLYFKLAEIGYMVLIPLAITLIYTLFKKKKSYIFLEVLNFLVKFTLLGSLFAIVNDLGLILQFADVLMISTLVSFVIICYWLLSNRVKETFI